MQRMKNTTVVSLLAAAMAIILISSTTVRADAASQTPIMNNPTTTVAQMEAYYKANETYPSYYKTTDAPTLTDFCQMYYDESVDEGVDPAVSFCQAMLETGFLRFNGRVPISAFNFGGLGAVDGDSKAYETFPNVRTGIRAQVQHLKAYASTESLNKSCVDTRFSLIRRGCAPYVEWLGQNENPSGSGWATSKGYGNTIANEYMAKLYTFPSGTSTQNATVTSAGNGRTYYFKNSIANGDADAVVVYGKSDDEVFSGNWNGSGDDTLCARRGNVYYFKNSIADGEADNVVAYGKQGDEVYSGDWDGDGTDTLCVRRGNIYYFKNSITDGEADNVIAYGKATDDVIVGDWDGDGKDTLCVRRGNVYYFKNSIADGEADNVIAYGKATDLTYSGDWDGNGTDTLCVRRDNIYYCKNSIADGEADNVVAYGKSTDGVLTGDWNGNMSDTLCARR